MCLGSNKLLNSELKRSANGSTLCSGVWVSASSCQSQISWCLRITRAMALAPRAGSALVTWRVSLADSGSARFSVSMVSGRAFASEKE